MNKGLEIPTARSQLIRYAAINKLIKEHVIPKDKKDKESKKGQQSQKTDEIKSFEDLLKKIGADKNRL